MCPYPIRFDRAGQRETRQPPRDAAGARVEEEGSDFVAQGEAYSDEPIDVKRVHALTKSCASPLTSGSRGKLSSSKLFILTRSGSAMVLSSTCRSGLY